jgi:hypothetical protein
MKASDFDGSVRDKVRGIHLVILIAVPLLFFAAVVVLGAGSAIRYGALALALVCASTWICLLRRASVSHRSGVMQTGFGVITRTKQPLLFRMLLWVHVLMGPLMGAVIALLAR